MSAVKSIMESCVIGMFMRVKLVPEMLESGDGLEGREKVKVSPSPERVKSKVSALALQEAIRMTARHRSLVGRRISLNSFQKMQDTNVVKVLTAEGHRSIGAEVIDTGFRRGLNVRRIVLTLHGSQRFPEQRFARF
jgi:hypothetical protein